MAENKEKDMHPRGRYNNDYSPKFREPYDIYDKAKEHMKALRREKEMAASGGRKDKEETDPYAYSDKYFENRACRFYPCHKNAEKDENGEAHINCLFCYCPMYHLTNCPGNPEYKEKNGKTIKVCTNCTYPHDKEHYEKVMEVLRETRGTEV